MKRVSSPVLSKDLLHFCFGWLLLLLILLQCLKNIVVDFRKTE